MGGVGLGNAATLHCPSLRLYLFPLSLLRPPHHARAFTPVSEPLQSKDLFQFGETQMKEIGLLPRSCWLGPPTPQSLLTTGPQQDRCSVCILPAFPVFIFLPGIPDYCSIGLIVSNFLRLNTPTLKAEHSAPIGAATHL